jgi:hypothetical protein
LSGEPLPLATEPPLLSLDVNYENLNWEDLIFQSEKIQSN